MASDLISRDALLEAMENKYDVAEKTGLNAVGLDCGFIITDKIIREQSTVDAVEVVRGEWERIPYSFAGGYRCSCCGHKTLERHWNYCPDCGADMRGEKNASD